MPKISNSLWMLSIILILCMPIHGVLAQSSPPQVQSPNAAPNAMPNAPKFPSKSNRASKRNTVIQQQMPVQNTYPNRSQWKGNSRGDKDTKELLKALPKVAMKKYEHPQIQIALILDVSGSMGGLLNQTREELWQIINSFAEMRYQGKIPEVRVSLYTQGMNRSSTGLYLAQRLALTTDLDKVSEILFALKIEGSQEYSPSSLYAATQGLAWSQSQSDLKAVIIAGNETFIQGPLSMEKAFQVAESRQLTTHTIYCGSQQEGIKDHWQKAAQMGSGKFLNIDQNAKRIVIDTPYDDEIQALNNSLNDTYIPYGADGQRGLMNQKAQDQNASRMSKSSAVQRSMTKSAHYYNNAGWDLVDALKQKKVKLDKIDVKQLPKALQKLSPQERKAYIAQKQKQRTQIQDKMKELKKKRLAYIQQERLKLQKQNKDKKQRLGSVLVDALKQQALQLGFAPHK